MENARIRHLIAAVGPSAVVDRFGRSTFVRAPEIGEELTQAAADSIERTLRLAESWVDTRAITLRTSRPRLVIGLFADREAYERYLVHEGLRGLTGSLGMTHPVRNVSIAVATEPKIADPGVIMAHESLHLWSLRTGLCPAWHVWPRWLHEGFAQLWDHQALASDRNGPAVADSRTESLAIITPNPARLSDWRRIAASTDLDRFLRRDMIGDRRRHGADYATSWALTYTLATRGGGENLAELIHHLQIQAMQPFDKTSPESLCLDWFSARFGPSWNDIKVEIAGLGRA